MNLPWWKSDHILVPAAIYLVALTFLLLAAGCGGPDGDPATTIISEAEELGQLAYEAGLEIDSNPYGGDGSNRREWIRGWCTAKIQSQAMAVIDAKRLAEKPEVAKSTTEVTPAELRFIVEFKPGIKGLDSTMVTEMARRLVPEGEMVVASLASHRLNAYEVRVRTSRHSDLVKAALELMSNVPDMPDAPSSVVKVERVDNK